MCSASFIQVKLVFFVLFMSSALFCCQAEDTSSDITTEKNSAPKTRPNIVFIYSDDHATAAIRSYGNSVIAPHVKTPNIDALAAQGLRFDKAFCTNGICAPARAVVLTGKHSHINGVRDNGQLFDGSQVTFPKLLRDAGYQTALIGKWHLKTNPTGFDYWDILPGQGQYYSPDFIRPAANYDENASAEVQKKQAMVVKRRIAGHVTQITTDLGLEWLNKKRDDSRPFLLMLQHKAPHRSWMPSPEQHVLYEGQELPEPSNLLDSYAGRATGASTQEMTIAKHMWLWYDLKIPPAMWGDNQVEHELTGPDRWTGNIHGRMNEDQAAAWQAAYEPRNKKFRDGVIAGKLKGDALTRWKYQRYIKDYLRCIAGVDESVGQVMAWLKANDLDENTIVIYSSDQGFFLGEHGWYDKRWMYEESLQIPLIVRWPGVIREGRTDKHLVQNLDFAPTLLDAARVAIPKEMQGQSLMPILKGGRQDLTKWRKSIYYRYFEVGIHAVEPHYGVRTERFKLIYYDRLKEYELFDLVKDPKEMQNCVAFEEYSETRFELIGELSRLRERFGDR
ncbi:MAG: arylsulfatase A-like enzyme [Planctomycetota bacterium]|jgi:arylsulfatase A-like enzyme